MSYLRLSPDEYQTICRLSEQIPLGGTTSSALRHFLVAYMPLDQLALAKRIARLNNRLMRLLYKHLLAQTESGAPERHPCTFSEAEVEVITRTIVFPRHPLRFLRQFQKLLVERLSDHCLPLARKLARLSERQFGLLYEHVKGRQEGSA